MNKNLITFDFIQDFIPAGTGMSRYRNVKVIDPNPPAPVEEETVADEDTETV